MPYYTNISNPELYYFHNLPVKNFTIKLTDLLTSGLFKVDEIITDSIYKIYPLFYTNTITSSNSEDKILDNKCLICTKKDKETYITFIRNSDEEIVDYNNYATYYDIDDNLTTNQFNAYVSLIRHNTINNDNIRIADNVNGAYGTYEFNLDGCTILDNGIVITDETITAQPQVRLTDKVFHYSTYTLKLNILHYTGVNILDDITPTDFIIVDTLEIELTPYQWIPIPISNIENGYVIDFDTVVEIKHDKPAIPDIINFISVTGEPTTIQTGEYSELYATGYDNGHVPVSTGHTIHFYEKIEPIINVSASQSIIQTSDNTEIYAKVKDSDGSLATDVKVHFYKPEAPVPTTLSVVADNPVLSYSDGDKAVLSATVRDQGSMPMSNQSVVFKVGDTVLDTVMTDGNGVAEYEYESQGVGDVTFTVECGSVSETITIEDCLKYYDGEITSTINPNLSLPSSYKIEYDIIKNANSSSTSIRVRVGDSSNSLHTGFDASSNTDLVLYDGTNVQKITGLALNTWASVLLEVNGTSRNASMTALNSTKSITVKNGVDLTNLYQIDKHNDATIRNVKIKPL